MKFSHKAAIISVFLLAGMAHAHDGHAHIAPDHWLTAWSFEPWVIAGLAVTMLIYLLGLRNMRVKVPKSQRIFFIAGMAALALTLLSPIHKLGSELFSVHMTQHELLMLVVAPLLVFGRPGTPMLWALPFDARIKLTRMIHWVFLEKIWAIGSAPFAVWILHGITLWLWHVPLLYQATLDNEFVHAAQHTTFLGTALLFWWTLFYGRGGRMGYGTAVAYIFTTAVHTSVLGALLTCSSRLWYPAYLGRTEAWGLTALQDQQLGGLIMWVPAGLVYIALGLWLFAAWLRESDKRLTYARSNDLLHTLQNKGVQDA
ncbi:MAG TPA: cytochrome c oxidase assembly protein [Candidatus Angelobacter sp.]|nr:cytochrome c oxidase assembly protein [Candidatus Angelobacter sp.]